LDAERRSFSPEQVLGNVSAAVMATSLLRPTLMDEEIQRTSWPRFALLGVAYASNIGGMLSPVASPQNLIAFTAIQTAMQAAPADPSHTGLRSGESPLSFGTWVAIAFPFCTVLVLLCWLFLCAIYRKQLPSALPPITIEHARPGKGGSALSTAFVVGISLLTILLWVAFDHVTIVKRTFGHIGVVGLIPIVSFGACGYITKVDFNGMPWDLLVLIGGGLSLGLAVESSGLLIAIGDRLTASLSADLGGILLAFSCLVAVLANFISSTVAAVILLPLVATVGNAIGHPKLLVTLCAFMTSGAMGLPVRRHRDVSVSRNSKLCLIMRLCARCCRYRRFRTQTQWRSG
jgi:phosphate transporter